MQKGRQHPHTRQLHGNQQKSLANNTIRGRPHKETRQASP